MEFEDKVARAILIEMGGEDHVSESGREMARVIAAWVAKNEYDHEEIARNLRLAGRWLIGAATCIR